MTAYRGGEWVVVDGTLRVQVIRTLPDGRIAVETGHGSLVVAPERLVALA